MRRAVVGLLVLVVLAIPALAQDPVKVASQHYSVVLENDEVRVLRAVLAPGDKTPMHDHPNTVVVPLTAASGRFTLADGKSQEHKLVAGTPVWIGAEKHAVENTGKTKVEVIVVELKRRQ